MLIAIWTVERNDLNYHYLFNNKGTLAAENRDLVIAKIVHPLHFLREAAKKISPLVVRPLRKGGLVKAGPVKKNNFFEAIKKVPMPTKLEGGGEIMP